MPPRSLRTGQAGRRAGGSPVYTYDRVPGVPPVSVLRLGGPEPPPGEAVHDHAHAHDFLVLAYFERGGGSIRLGARTWPVEAGDAYLIAPGDVVEAANTSGRHRAAGWAVFFPPDLLGARTPGAFLSWRAHPLLFPFVRGTAEGAQRLAVPPGDRSAWSERFSALELELRERRESYSDAVMAQLTLLLVAASRLAADVVGDLKLGGQPLLAEVFSFIEERYDGPISLKDVAAAVHLSPGHLTTVVGRKTGRTVQEWITEQRMAEARRLLVETDLNVQEISRNVGYRDPGHFARSFKRNHDVTPLAWRRAGRS